MTPQQHTTNRTGPVQPGTHIDRVNDLTNEEFIRTSVPNAGDLVTEDSIQVTYQSDFPNTDNDLDALHDERVASIERIKPNNTICLVTVDILHGDCFEFTYAPGTWMFVGTHILDDQTMLFVPADDAARANQPVGAYKTFLRADLAMKISGKRPSEIRRVQRTDAVPPVRNLNPDTTPGCISRLRNTLTALLTRQ